MNCLGPRISFIAVLASAVVLWGCGSTNSFTGTPTASGTTPSAGTTNGGSSGSPGGTPSGSGGSGTPSGSGGSSGSGSSGGSGGNGGGGSTAGFSDQLAACGTKNGTAYQITGRVIDATTGQPIVGKVIANIDPVDRGDSINQNPTGTDGRWSSANLVVGMNSFAVAVMAISSSGVAYAPKILIPSASCPITQGTDIGTIALSPASTVNSTVMFTGQTATGTPAQISVELRAVRTNYAGIDWSFGLDPYLLKFREDLQTGPQCPANTSCLTNNFSWAATPALAASYAGASTTFQPVASSAVWTMSATWNNSLSNSLANNHCTPTFAFSGPKISTPGTTLNFGTLAFTGC